MQIRHQIALEALGRPPETGLPRPAPSRRSSAAWAVRSSALALWLVAGCVVSDSDIRGRTGPGSSSGATSSGASSGGGSSGASSSGASSSGASSSGATSSGGTLVERPKVTLPSASLRLLPFDVRLRRVASAVNVPVGDAVFEAARKQRLALGAHDYINGTAPDLQWNAQRMAAWVEAMLPVCKDTRVRANLGDWKNGGVEKFAQAAYGRPATPEDLADLATVLALSGDDGWVATCLSLVSSAEVLLQ